MRIFNREKLLEFMAGHADSRARLQTWFHLVSEAQWETPLELLLQFPRASILKDNKVVFRIGNSYRIEVLISYNTGIVIVQRIGTHAEDDRWSK